MDNLDKFSKIQKSMHELVEAIKTVNQDDLSKIQIESYIQLLGNVAKAEKNLVEIYVDYLKG